MKGDKLMKKILTLITAMLMTLIMTGCTMTEIPTKTTVHQIEVPPKMMFLGDSIAAGYGLEGYAYGDNYNCKSYSNILREKYEHELADECGHKMVNKAVSGATSADFLELLKSGELDSDLKTSDAIVISIGGNDLLGILFDFLRSLGFSEESGEFNTSEMNIFSAAAAFLTMDSDMNNALTGFETNLKEIADILNEKTNGEIYIQTLYDPLEYFADFKKVTEFSEEKIGRFNSIIKENSQGKYSVLDVAAEFKGKAGELTTISKFDIHPNPQGHEKISEIIDRTFRAKGFTYTTSETGERQLTAEGKTAIFGIIALVLLLFITAIVLLLKKGKNNNAA